MAIGDPKRLRDEASGSPLLSNVLEALCERESDAARVARVSERLGGLLDAPPPPPAASTPGRVPHDASLVTKLGGTGLALKLVLGTVVGVFIALWGGGDRGAVLSDGASSTQGSSGVLAPGQRSDLLERPPVARQTPVQLLNEPPSSTRAAEAPGSRTGSRFRTGNDTETTPKKHRELQRRAEPPARIVHGGDVDSMRDETTPVEQSPNDSVLAVAPAVQAPATPDAERSPRSLDELGLLLGARAVLVEDPGRALLFLAEHKSRYPDGALAPEREVLAIDALQRMGRAAEAKLRRDSFERRYPDSFHLKRPSP